MTSSCEREALEVIDRLKPSAGSGLLGNLHALLVFRAPYVEDKLLQLGVAASREEAFALLQEVKKYMVIAETHPGWSVPLVSTRIDEAWHQFVLFTAQYSEFCARYAGHLVHHVPAGPDGDPPADGARPVLTFSQFRDAYERLFGELSSAWQDELFLNERTRLAPLPLFQRWEIRTQANAVSLVWLGETLITLCTVSRRGQPALEFIARERSFLLRELPGLAAAERIDLCRPLVAARVLRIVP